MDYQHNLSMANLHNIVVALNQGGVLSCYDLMERIWDAASPGQRERKINAPADVYKRTEEFARVQVMQEIRRSIYEHYNMDRHPELEILRVIPVDSAEMFYVTSPQEISHVRRRRARNTDLRISFALVEEPSIELDARLREVLEELATAGV